VRWIGAFTAPAGRKMNTFGIFAISFLFGACGYRTVDVALHWIFPDIMEALLLLTLGVPAVVLMIYKRLISHPRFRERPSGVSVSMLLGIWMAVSGGGIPPCRIRDIAQDATNQHCLVVGARTVAAGCLRAGAMVLYGSGHFRRHRLDWVGSGTRRLTCRSAPSSAAASVALDGANASAGTTNDRFCGLAAQRQHGAVPVGQSDEHRDVVAAVCLLAPRDHRQPLPKKIANVDQCRVPVAAKRTSNWSMPSDITVGGFAS